VAVTGYPEDLVDLQRRLVQAWKDLEELNRLLPWSAEPAEAWTSPHPVLQSDGTLAQKEFPASPGYSEEQSARVKELRAQITELGLALHAHEYWTHKSGKGPAMLALRNAVEADMQAG
jgi:hypothetical protein